MRGWRRSHRLRPGVADEFTKAVKAAGGKIAGREYTNDKATDYTFGGGKREAMRVVR